jgi:hypothetical protein
VVVGATVVLVGATVVVGATVAAVATVVVVVAGASVVVVDVVASQLTDVEGNANEPAGSRDDVQPTTARAHTKSKISCRRAARIPMGRR